LIILKGGKKLKTLNQRIHDCQKCQISKQTPKKIIGRGSLKPKFLFIGLNGGKEESKEGRPFVGPSGKLLDKWVEYLGLGSEDYAVVNLIKCYTRSESDLSGDEARNCLPYLQEQIRLLSPTHIIPLGSKPAHTLLNTNIGIIKLSGRKFTPLEEGPSYIPLPHPSYFLRRGSKGWEQFLDLAKEAMDESKTFTTFPSEIEGFQESQNIVLTEPETKYVPLHVHTTHSVTDSLVLPETLAEKCKEKGFSAAAITDHGSVTGWYQFQEACEKYEIKPILGAEFYVSNAFGDKDKNREHLVALAKNETGMKNIFKLQEISDRKGYYYKPRIRLEDLYKYHDGLVVLSACTQGIISQPFLKGQPGTSLTRLKKLQEVFGEDLYLELQPHYEYDDQKKSNKELIRLSEEFNIPLVITTDLHYIEKEDKKYHDLLKAVVFRQPLGEAGFSITTNYLMDSEDLIRKGKDTAVPEEITIEAMKNTIKVAEKCSVKLTPYKNALPRIKK